MYVHLYMAYLLQNSWNNLAEILFVSSVFVRRRGFCYAPTPLGACHCVPFPPTRMLLCAPLGALS